MSQEQRIFVHLKMGKTLTTMQALKMFGCFRLSARIARLKKLLPNIKTTMIRVGKNKRVAQYSL